VEYVRIRYTFAVACIGATALSNLVAAPAAQATDWFVADGEPCDAVCSNNNMLAISSGAFKNGELFFVCAADSAGEGVRPGFNLQPKWANICMVPWGKDARRETDYLCACE